MSRPHDFIPVNADAEFIGARPVICRNCLSVFGRIIHPVAAWAMLSRATDEAKRESIEASATVDWDDWYRLAFRRPDAL